MNLVFLKERTIDTDSYRKTVDGITLHMDVSTGDTDADEFLSDKVVSAGKVLKVKELEKLL